MRRLESVETGSAFCHGTHLWKRSPLYFKSERPVPDLRLAGNVRELQNVIERAVILSDGETFSVDETWLTRVTPKTAAPSVPLVANLIDHEREMIETALREAEGLVSGPTGAATKLGIPRQTLESKIRKLGINRHRFKTS